MSDVGGLPEAAPVSRAAVLEERYRRLPESLTTSPGRATAPSSCHCTSPGLVRRPSTWTCPRPACTCTASCPPKGQRGDVAAYLNRDLLLKQWPVLRNLIGRTVRRVREAAFPEL